VRLLIAVGLISLCVYVFGLILNDWADRERDREKRPHRPLARGAVDPGTAMKFGGVLAVAALLAAVILGIRVLLVVLLLLAVVMLYDLGLKESCVLGSLAMGACRGLNLLAGAVAVRAPLGPTWIPAVALAGYIAILTRLAMTEDDPQRPGPGTVLLPALPALALCLAAAHVSPGFLWALLSALSAAGCVGIAAGVLMRMHRAADQGAAAPFRAAVGAGLQALILWQAAYLFLTPSGAAPAALLLAGAAVARSLQTRYAGS